MKFLNSPYTAIAALALLAGLGYASLPYTTYTAHTKRLNCEDLGRCNLATGEVYSLEAVNAAKLLEIYNQ